jgi:hypothetical protein
LYYYEDQDDELPATDELDYPEEEQIYKMLLKELAFTQG